MDAISFVRDLVNTTMFFFFHTNSIAYNLLLINVGLSHPFNKEMHVKSLFLTYVNDVFDQDIQIYHSKNIINDCILIFTVVKTQFSTGIYLWNIRICQ